MNKDEQMREHSTKYEELECVNIVHRYKSILEEKICANFAERTDGECLLYATQVIVARFDMWKFWRKLKN